MEMEPGQGIRMKEREEIIILVLCRSFSDMNDPNEFLMGPASRREKDRMNGASIV